MYKVYPDGFHILGFRLLCLMWGAGALHIVIGKHIITMTAAIIEDEESDLGYFD